MSRIGWTRQPPRATAWIAFGAAFALAVSACSSSSHSPAATPTTHGSAVTVNHSAYRFATGSGLTWYMLPPKSQQRTCLPSCQAVLVRPAFRSAAIASVDTVPAGGGRWRLIVQLRRPAAARLVALTHHHRRGSEIVIGVGPQLLVHAPLQLPIVSGVWEISGLTYRTAVTIANQLQRIAVGYPEPRRHHRHHHQRHHHCRHHHRRHHSRH